MGGRRKPDRTESDIAGGGIEPTDFPARPESGVEVGVEYGQGGNEGGGDGEGVGSMGSPPQPDDSEAAAEHEREHEIGLQSKTDVGKGETVSQSASEEVLGNRRSREGGEVVVEGEVGPVDPPPRLSVGTSDKEALGSKW